MFSTVNVHVSLIWGGDFRTKLKWKREESELFDLCDIPCQPTTFSTGDEGSKTIFGISASGNAEFCPFLVPFSLWGQRCSFPRNSRTFALWGWVFKKKSIDIAVDYLRQSNPLLNNTRALFEEIIIDGESMDEKCKELCDIHPSLSLINPRKIREIISKKIKSRAEGDIWHKN